MLRLSAHIQRGIQYVGNQQLPNGSFVSFSGPTAFPFKPTLTYKTTFTPALILSAISSIDGAAAQGIRRNLTTWLLSQRSPAWSFNYWAADAPERERLPYPDDLDDTFCALMALYRHDPSLIDQACLASVVKLLIATESQVGGPYRTWLTTEDAPQVWQDVDLAVNANIAGFLRLVADPLPNITKLMEKAIGAHSFYSPYYPSPYPIIYYLARAYDGPRAAELIDWLVSQQLNGWWGNPLHTALAVSSLVRLGRADMCESAVQQLVASQRSDGSWPAIGFCIDPSIKSKTHYNGAAALTTALAIEALAAYQTAAQNPQKTTQKRAAGDQTTETLQRRITTAVLAETNKLSAALKTQTQATLKQTILQDDKHEITLLPYYFNQSLVEPLPEVNNGILVALGTANTFGWAAYTIYDNFLDNEGDPKLLSVANVALRYSLRYFNRALPNNESFQELTRHIFDTIDGANAWELAHCRMRVTSKNITISKLPIYKSTLSLADRSLGHTLTPLGVLAAAGIAPDDARAKAISLALCHYIAARQLNDDLHDWEQDLRAGIITYVVARILQESATLPGTHAFTKLIPKLQKHFWHHTLPTTCTIITRHTKLARRAARASDLLKAENLITQLTERIDAAVKDTLAEQAKAESFLSAYRS